MAPAADFDVFLTGTTFLDMIFTGLDGPPALGTESLSLGLGSAPGGIANLAVALSRLGLKVSLATVLGDDMFGTVLRSVLAEQEGVDLTHTVFPPGSSTPVTVSLSYGDDRSMITYHEPVADLDEVLPDDVPSAGCYFVTIEHRIPGWVAGRRRDGATVVADVGWDPTGAWSPAVLQRLAEVEVFLPNSVEAMAYTRTTTPEDALAALTDRVPTVVIKCGSLGALAADRGTGEVVREPAIQVDAVDPTGAGDVFAAGYMFAMRMPWTLAERIRFANLCAGLSVRHLSGSLGAPCWHDIVAWVAPRTDSDFGFLHDLLPPDSGSDRTRARPTLR